MNTTAEQRQEWIRQGQRMAYALAVQIHRSVPMKVDLEDLIAYGQVGLAQAAHEFDPQRGAQFTTFAYHRVRGAIYDGLSKMGWTSRARLRRFRVERVAEELAAQESSGGGSLADDARWLGDLTEKLAVVFLVSQAGEEMGSGEAAWVDQRASAPPTLVAQREISDRLRELIDVLPPVESRMIRLVYFEGVALQEAGKRLGMSKSWASRVHARILEKLGRSLRRMGASD